MARIATIRSTSTSEPRIEEAPGMPRFERSIEQSAMGHWLWLFDKFEIEEDPGIPLFERVVEQAPSVTVNWLRLPQGVTLSLGESPENILNRKRVEVLREKWSEQLIDLILTEDFEYGFSTRADVMVRNQMSRNSLATKEWLNSIFVEHFSDVPILLGILRIIARLDYYEVYPEGQTMAVAALSHSDTQVKECGVRAFEAWGTLDCLEILTNLRVEPPWLQAYIVKVAKDLEEENYATVG